MRAPRIAILPALAFVAWISATGSEEQEPSLKALAPPESSTPGALVAYAPDGKLVEMPLKHTSVSITVSAFVARATIEQVFLNPLHDPVEAVYTFPLGDAAAVDDFEFIIGDRTIRGEIHRREEARTVYEEARSAGYQAALLEQERPNIFTQSVANLEPGRSVRVRIRTVETLRYEKGSYRLTFPLVVGPRYIPQNAAGMGAAATTPAPPSPSVPDASRVTPPVLRPGFRSGHDVDIDVTIQGGVSVRGVSSPSHRIVIERPSAASARVRLAPDDTIPNKDFMLRWEVASDKPAVGLLAHREGVEGFFTLLVQPRAEVSVAEATPKEIVLAIDTSGSMQGIPIEASKRFIAKILRELGPRDSFNLIRFAGDNEVYSETPRPNERAEIERALEWVSRLHGEGGTEMLAALRRAFELPPDPDRLRLVIFLTDGYIGNENEILGEIARVVGKARKRIYPFLDATIRARSLLLPGLRGPNAFWRVKKSLLRPRRQQTRALSRDACV